MREGRDGSYQNRLFLYNISQDIAQIKILLLLYFLRHIIEKTISYVVRFKYM